MSTSVIKKNKLIHKRFFFIKFVFVVPSYGHFSNPPLFRLSLKIYIPRRFSLPRLLFKSLKYFACYSDKKKCNIFFF